MSRHNFFFFFFTLLELFPVCLLVVKACIDDFFKIQFSCVTFQGV